MADELPQKMTSYALMIFTIVTLCIAAAIGLTLYYTLPAGMVPLARTDSVGNCIPQGEETEERCDEKGCIWQEPSDGAPWCTFPADYGYHMVGEGEETVLGWKYIAERNDGYDGLFGQDIGEISVEIEYHSESRLRIKFADEHIARYEVPEAAVNIEKPLTPPENATRLYDVTVVSEPHFGVKVTRRSTGAVVFDSTVPGLVMSDQYHQLTTRLPSGNVYGFGEHNHERFHHDMHWRKWSIFTRDHAPIDDYNLYGHQPIYMNLETDGNANGVLLFNSNAMDVVLQPNPHPAITYHVIGGILDFYIFLGPTPENVVQQYTEAVGRPVMVPYWSLGFQLSRWDYDNLSHVEEVVQRNIDAHIPFDVQYGDIDYMFNQMDFTIDPIKYAGLPEFVDKLHSQGMRYIIILDHIIGSNTTIHDMAPGGTYPPYTEGVDQNIFIRHPHDDQRYLEGEVWPGLSVYPDFTKGDDVTRWWTDQCEEFYYDQNVKYDALWIDMNEPSNFIPGSIDNPPCEDNDLNYPPYVPRILGAEWVNGGLFDKTICMDAPQEWGLHYDVHSLYGHSMSQVTFRTLEQLFPEKRALVLSRSQFVGSQKYSVHWLGDNRSWWHHLHTSIVGMLEYSLFGFSYTGADICGFWEDTTEQMCQRWMQLGAFYPYARNHNAQGWRDQDPAAFGPEMIRVSRDILRTRYKLLPFLYTLLYQAHAHGNTVVRPLLHEFPTDTRTWSIDRQFLWGPSLLISAALEKDQLYVPLYLPEGRWYDYYGGGEMSPTGEIHNLSTPLDKINLHVRGGHVIPWQVPDNTTVFSRLNPMGMIVALGSPPGFQAEGWLYWDDGETSDEEAYLLLHFTCENFKLDIVVENDGYSDDLQFETIQIWGLDRPTDEVWVDDELLHTSQVDYNPVTHATTLINLDLSITDAHTVEWTLPAWI